MDKISNHMYWIMLSLFFSVPSCKENTRQQYRKYDLSISEIDCSSNKAVISFKNVFISSSEGLFEYDFRLKTKNIVSENSKFSASSEDSVSISFIQQKEPFYYKFDFEGNLLKKDSIKYKQNDFIKIDTAHNKEDPLYKVMDNLNDRDLTDTIINDQNLMVYRHPLVLKDSVGEMMLQLFFSKDTLLRTPFNVNNRYPMPFNKYNLVGIAFTLLNTNRKMIAIVSNVRAVTTKEEGLCDKILNKIKTINFHD